MMRSHDFVIRATSYPLGMKFIKQATLSLLETKFMGGKNVQQCCTFFAFGDGDFSPTGREAGGMIILSQWDRILVARPSYFRPTGLEV